MFFMLPDSDDEEREDLLREFLKSQEKLFKLYSENDLTMERLRQWPRHEAGHIQTLKN